MLNEILLQGRLTKDVELRYTQSQKPVASFTLAVDRDGENTDFIDCVAWNGTADFVSKYFSKGNAAIVEGKLTIRDWTDKNGNKRKSAEVICDRVHFCERKTDAKPVDVQYSKLEDADPGLPF